MRYPDEKFSDEDELEGDGLADLVSSLKRMSLKDSEKETEGQTSKGTTKKEKTKKNTLQEPAQGGEKKAVRRQKAQRSEPEPTASELPLRKKHKGEGKKKKRQVEADTAESTPKKKKAKGTPSAALRRAPDAEPQPVLEVPPGAAPMVIEQKSSLDEQLEAHLLGMEPPATVAQQSQTATRSIAPQGPDMGGFLAGLRKSIPQAGAQQTVVTTPDQTPDCEGVASHTGSERNSRRVDAGNSTTNCIEVIRGEGRYHHGNWKTRICPHGHGSTGGTNSALKQIDNR